MIIYLRRNGDTKTYLWFSVDKEASDEQYWRGYTFDNNWLALSKAEYYEIPNPEYQS